MQPTPMTRPLLAARPIPTRLLDIAIATATFVASMAFLSHGGVGAAQQGSEVNLLGVLLAASAALPLVAWRRAPFGVFVWAAATSALAAGLGYSIGIPLGPATVALYLLVANRNDADPWTPRSTAAMLALFLTYAAATAADDGTFPANELLHTSLSWAVAWFAGERTRLRREHVSELEDRALRAEREADQERRLAAAEERARTARDVHDSVGQTISVIAVRAGAARLRHDADPERSRAALQAIEQMARQTIGELDQIVGTLRDREPSGGVEAPPGLASLDALIEHHTSAGLDVTVATAGAPRPLTSPVDQASYRILQEALTNAARHGTGSARIELAYRDTGLDLTVANPVASAARARATGGHGLIGMHERANLLGGRLHASQLNGDYHLQAHLPYRDHDA